VEDRGVQRPWRKQDETEYGAQGTLENEKTCNEHSETHLLDLYALLDLFSRLSQPKDYPKTMDGRG
jgi:hypothetical protein